MGLAISLVLLGICLLVLGGESLLRGAVGLATLMNMTPAVIGLTVVAAGTSVPELAVSGIAAYKGSNEIAVANVVGSNIFNITLILGLCSIIRPFEILGNTLKLEYPVLAIATFLCVVNSQDKVISRLDALLFLCIYLAFTIYLIRLVRKQLTPQEKVDLNDEVSELQISRQKPSLLVCITLFVIGVVLLGVGAQSTVTGASQLARMWGWSERLIGLTIVSIGTGLPEVVASLVSSFRGRSDVAIGNVIGSNLFNILVILGLSGLIAPLGVQPTIASSDSWWMLGVTILMAPILWNGKKIYRWEGMILIFAYATYIASLLSNITGSDQTILFYCV